MRSGGGGCVFFSRLMYGAMYYAVVVALSLYAHLMRGGVQCRSGVLLSVTQLAAGIRRGGCTNVIMFSL